MVPDSTSGLLQKAAKVARLTLENPWRYRGVARSEVWVHSSDSGLYRRTSDKLSLPSHPPGNIMSGTTLSRYIICPALTGDIELVQDGDTSQVVSG